MQNPHIVSLPGYGLSFAETDLLIPRSIGWCSAREQPFDVDAFLDLPKIKVSRSFLAHAPHEWLFPQTSIKMPYIGYMIKGFEDVAFHKDIRREASLSAKQLLPLSDLDEIAQIILAQADGKEGLLLTSGQSNIFYINGLTDVSIVVCRFCRYRNGWELEGGNSSGYFECGAQVLFPLLKEPYLPPRQEERETIKSENFLTRLLRAWEEKPHLKSNGTFGCHLMSVIPARTKPYNMRQFLEHVAKDSMFEDFARAPQSEKYPIAPRFYTRIQLRREKTTTTGKRLLTLLPDDSFASAEDIAFLVLRNWEANGKGSRMLCDHYASRNKFFVKTADGPAVVVVNNHFGSWSIQKGTLDSIWSEPVIVRGKTKQSENGHPPIVSYLAE